MKTALLALAALAALSLSGCSKSGYGEYNIGVCMLGGMQFIESHVDVEKNSFTILANAVGPKQVQQNAHPLVLNFVKEVNGVRTYEVKMSDGALEQVSITIAADGELSGAFVVDGVGVATLHGHKGALGNLGPDGSVEYDKSCGAHAPEVN